MGLDSRIGNKFLKAGIGYGGSCFPKDVQALIKIAEKKDYQTKILNSVEEVNKNQKLSIVNKVVKEFGDDLSNLTFGVWGLAFKPNTDDMREASSITIINELTNVVTSKKAQENLEAQSLKKSFGTK